MRALYSKYNHYKRAFSLLEVLVTVAVIGVIAAIAAVNYGGARSSSSSAKLQSDVRSINGAITMYLASGGNLDGIADPQAVLDKLKTTRSDEDKRKFSGLGGTAIDKRLVVRLQTGDEISSSAPRAVWNGAEKRFEIGAAGVAGIGSFELDEALASADFGTESRGASAIDRNVEDGWLWKDDKAITAVTGLAPSIVDVQPTVPSTPPFQKLSGRLVPPVITPGKRSFTVFDFPITADFINPTVNDPTKSAVLFAIKSPVSTDLIFRKASGPISITRDQTIVAFAKSLSPDTKDSSSTAAVFTIKAFDLEPPKIDADRNVVELDSGGKLNLELIDVNPPGSQQQLEFSVSGQPFQEFNGPTEVVSAASLINGLIITARSRALNSDFADSAVSKPVRFKVKLATPVVDIQVGGDKQAVDSLKVDIKNVNPKGSSTVFFKILNQETGQEDAFKEFVGPFEVSESDFPKGFILTAVARSNKPVAFDDSDEASDLGLSFFGIPLRENSVLLLDKSGSMAGPRIAKVRAETVRLLGVLPPGFKFSIAQFQSTSQVLVSMRAATPANISSAQTVVRGILQGGGTNYAPALRLAGTQFSGIRPTGSKTVNQVILLSDGKPNDARSTIDAAVRALVRKNIVVDTIGFQTDSGTSKTLRDIASLGGGQFNEVK